MKLLIFNMGYGKGWTSPHAYFKNQNVMGKITDFVKKVNPDIIGMIEIKVPGQSDELKKLFKYYLASCKYHPKAHRIPLINEFGNAVYSQKKGIMKKRFLSSGIKRLVIDSKFPQFRLLIVHLSLNQGSRAKQILELSRFAGRKTIIAGDFNIQNSKELEPLTANGFRSLIDSPTFPSWNPKKHFDQVFVSSDIKAKAKVLNVKLSDHLPVLVEI